MCIWTTILMSWYRNSHTETCVSEQRHCALKRCIYAVVLAPASLSSASYLFKSYLSETNCAGGSHSNAGILWFCRNWKSWKLYSRSTCCCWLLQQKHTSISADVRQSLPDQGHRKPDYLQKANSCYDMFKSDLLYDITDWSDQNDAALVLGTFLD